MAKENKEIKTQEAEANEKKTVNPALAWGLIGAELVIIVIASILVCRSLLALF